MLKTRDKAVKWEPIYFPFRNGKSYNVIIFSITFFWVCNICTLQYNYNYVILSYFHLIIYWYTPVVTCTEGLLYMFNIASDLFKAQ